MSWNRMLLIVAHTASLPVLLRFSLKNINRRPATRPQTREILILTASELFFFSM